MSRALPLHLLAGVVAGEVPRGFLLAGAPLLLGVLVDHRGFGKDGAATLVSMEMLAAALAAIGVAGHIARSSRVATASLGFALVILGHGASGWVLDPAWLAAFRVVAGLGAGLAGAAATAAASGAPDPERLFAVASVVGGVAGSFAVLPLGSAIAAAGADGMFLFMVVATAVVAPLLRGLPAPASAAAGAAPRIRRAGAASLVLAGFFLFALGQNAVWAFTERIAKDLGIDVETMAMILAVTNLLGLAGAGGAALLGLRVGRRVPLLGSVAVTMVATAFLVEARGIGGFVAANLFWALGFFFAMPYFLGTLATLDDRGRWAAIGTGLASVGAALGPAAAGLVLAEQGYGPLLGLVLACGGVAVALLAPVLTRLDKESALLAAGEA